MSDSYEWYGGCDPELEAGKEQEDLFDKVIVVTCERETAIRRLMEDRDFTREEAEARLSHQIDPSVQIAKADVVFHNDGSIKDLDRALGSWLMKQRKERHGTEHR